MKKFSITIWTVIILGSIFVIVKFLGSVDISQIPNPYQKTQENSSTTASITSTSTNIDVSAVTKNTIPLTTATKNVLNVEIVDTPESRAQGLSGRSVLGEKNGMLFVFDTENIYSFWMKDMNFPLDIVWIDKNKKIIDISEQISPETYPKSFEPKSKVLYVLEINALKARKFGLTIGSTVTF